MIISGTSHLCRDLIIASALLLPPPGLLTRLLVNGASGGLRPRHLRLLTPRHATFGSGAPLIADSVLLQAEVLSGHVSEERLPTRRSCLWPGTQHTGPGVKDGADYGQCRLRRECRPSAAYAAAAPLLPQSDAYQMRRQPQQLIVTDCSRRAGDRTGATGWGM